MPNTRGEALDAAVLVALGIVEYVMIRHGAAVGQRVGDELEARAARVLAGRCRVVAARRERHQQQAALHVVGRDATLKQVVVTLGGDLVRLVSNVQYAGPGGSADLFGVYFADETQHQEHRLWVDHGTPNCRSNVVYKGALQGEKAHTVWVGDVRIRPAAVGTDTYELNRNLVLTDGARADSVPNLEIETGQIEGAGHASSTGRFDDEQLFYLMSRGVPEDEARRLVVRGFFVDIIAKIGVPEVQETLRAAIEEELEVEMGGAA